MEIIIFIIICYFFFTILLYLIEDPEKRKRKEEIKRIGKQRNLERRIGYRWKNQCKNCGKRIPDDKTYCYDCKIGLNNNNDNDSIPTFRYRKRFDGSVQSPVNREEAYNKFLKETKEEKKKRLLENKKRVINNYKKIIRKLKIYRSNKRVTEGTIVTIYDLTNKEEIKVQISKPYKVEETGKPFEIILNKQKEDEKVISTESALAKAIMGYKAGSIISYNGIDIIITRIK